MKARVVLLLISGMLVGIGLSNLILRPTPHWGYGLILVIGVATLLGLAHYQLDKRNRERAMLFNRIRRRGPIRFQIEKDGPLYHLGHDGHSYYLYEDEKTSEVERVQGEYD